MYGANFVNIYKWNLADMSYRVNNEAEKWLQLSAEIWAAILGTDGWTIVVQ